MKEEEKILLWGFDGYGSGGDLNGIHVPMYHVKGTPGLIYLSSQIWHKKHIANRVYMSASILIVEKENFLHLV